MVKMVTVSAPGKVHLIGEHSVVYGKPAIIAAVGLRCYVDAEKSDNVTFESRDFGNADYPAKDVLETAERAGKLWEEGRSKGNFSSLFAYCRTDRLTPLVIATGIALKRSAAERGIRLRIKSEIPTGSGLGSSSAIAVSLSKAVAEAYGKKLSNEEINETAFEIEKINHGNPSGGDNSACCFGGLIWFQKNSPKNIIMPFNAGASRMLDKFVLVHTGRPVKTTGELVQAVGDLPESYRSRRISKLEELTRGMRQALETDESGRVGEIIREAQRILAELGVSTDKINNLAAEVGKIGGAAKLCGAGGGGTVLCFHEDKEKLKALIAGLGYDPLDARLGAEGVRKEGL